MERRELSIFYDGENNGGIEVEDTTVKERVYSKKLHINYATWVNKSDF